MNFKWFVGIVIIALVCIGVRMEQSILPNQEIVLQFSDTTVSANETNNALAIVTKQLQSLGVEEIQIVQSLDGSLKITYYSTLDIAVVKDLFAKQNQFQLGLVPFADRGTSSHSPFESAIATYELNVSEIQTAIDADMGLHGALIEIKVGHEGYVNALQFAGSAAIVFCEAPTHENKEPAQDSKRSLGIDTSSYKIPEVRAGPLC